MPRYSYERYFEIPRTEAPLVGSTITEIYLVPIYMVLQKITRSDKIPPYTFRGIAITESGELQHISSTSWAPKPIQQFYVPISNEISLMKFHPIRSQTYLSQKS